MVQEKDLNPVLKKKMLEEKIDISLTLKVLNNLNQGLYDNQQEVVAEGFPSIDGKTVIDTGADFFVLPVELAERNIDTVLPGIDLEQYGEKQEGQYRFSSDQLKALGVRLYPQLAYGILNGGSATSYIDQQKNNAFSSELMQLVGQVFRNAAQECRGKPKGITPAFFNQDGSSGPSFMEMKIRSLLVECFRYKLLTGKPIVDGIPLFQMTSVYTDQPIQQECVSYAERPIIKPLVAETNTDIGAAAMSSVQPLMAAYTHSELGAPRTIFDNAYGNTNSPLPLPGGHGQCFLVLKEIFKKLYAQGRRFVYLTNIDNLGNIVDPAGVARLALSGKPAAFEFSFKTPVDVKGGVLVHGSSQKLYCADMGAAISRESVTEAEAAGQPVLFNCATGLFDLKQLLPKIDWVIDNLPMRVSDQDKDAGRYSQAEQITWEVIGLLDDFLVFGVEKSERFLAAKLLLENLVSSGIALDDPSYPAQLKDTALAMREGMDHLLESVYGMKKSGSSWVPLTPEELAAQWGFGS